MDRREAREVQVVGIVLLSESQLNDIHDWHFIPQRRRLRRVTRTAAASYGEAVVGVDACLAAGVAASEGAAMLPACMTAAGAGGRAVALDAAAALVDGKQLFRGALGTADPAYLRHPLRDRLVARAA